MTQYICNHWNVWTERHSPAILPTKTFVWTLVENMAGIIIIALRMVTVLEIARIVFVFILAVLL